MGLPIVSMEDDELFTKVSKLDISKEVAEVSIDNFDKPNASLFLLCQDPTFKDYNDLIYRRAFVWRDGLTVYAFYMSSLSFKLYATSKDELWWSRLVIAIRGYVVNYLKKDENKLFSCDDAFIILHKIFVEKAHDFTSLQVISSFFHTNFKYLGYLNKIVTYPKLVDTLEKLEILRGRIDEKDPFLEPETSEAFITIFGQPNYATYRIANYQIHAYIPFMRVLGTLIKRWVDEQGTKKKGIRFDKDPEWQPAERVVIFEEFFRGNRTWVLYDFDRHVLNFWRPKGTNVIFGDRYIEKKRRSGHELCSYCGMLEQAPGQFQPIQNHRFCSEQCLAAMIDAKVIKV